MNFKDRHYQEIWDALIKEYQLGDLVYYKQLSRVVALYEKGRLSGTEMSALVTQINNLKNVLSAYDRANDKHKAANKKLQAAGLIPDLKERRQLSSKELKAKLKMLAAEKRKLLDN